MAGAVLRASCCRNVCQADHVPEVGVKVHVLMHDVDDVQQLCHMEVTIYCYFELPKDVYTGDSAVASAQASHSGLS